eukprot:1690828-Rhodomonas_salina.2
MRLPLRLVECSAPKGHNDSSSASDFLERVPSAGTALGFEAQERGRKGEGESERISISEVTKLGSLGSQCGSVREQKAESLRPGPEYERGNLNGGLDLGQEPTVTIDLEKSFPRAN